MVRFCEPMFDAVLTTDLIEPMDPIACRPAIAIARQVSKLNAVIGEDGMQPVRDGFDQVFQERDGGGSVSLTMQLHKGELRRAIDRHEEIELALFGTYLGDVDMEVADRVGLELPLLQLVAVHVRQPTDAVALQAAMQFRSSKVRDGRLQAIEAIVQRQQRVTPERHDHRLFIDRQNGRMNSLRSHGRIVDARSLPPLLNRGRADSMSQRQRPHALFTPLYRSTDRLCRRGAAV